MCYLLAETVYHYAVIDERYNEHSLSVGSAAVLETGPLPPQDHKSETVRCPVSDYVGCHTASSGGY